MSSLGAAEISACEYAVGWDDGKRTTSVYMDANATAVKLKDEALRAMFDAYEKTNANPSSVHHRGRKAKEVLDRARTTVLQLLDAPADKATLVFTSGCSEANNTVIRGAVEGFGDPSRAVVVTSTIEHDSVLNCVSKNGYRAVYVPCDSKGRIVEDALRSACEDHRGEVALVSIIAAQNEVGTVQRVPDLVAVVRRCAGPKALVHVDATQLLGRYRVSVRDTLGDPDLVTGSAHKFGGPKGCGLLYVRDRALIASGRLRPLLRGGSQEGGFRAGTENVAGAAGAAAALLASVGDPARLRVVQRRVGAMRDSILEGLVRELGPRSVRVNGDLAGGLYNTLNVTLKYSGNHALAWLLDREGFCVSSGSACSRSAPSHVLMAMGISTHELRKTVRISLGEDNTPEECAALVKHVKWLADNVLDRRA